MKKKRITWTILIVSAILITGCASEESYDEIKGKIETNLANILMETKNGKDTTDFTEQRDYREILSKGANAAIILEDMYTANELSEEAAYIAANAIEDITSCPMEEKYDITWETPQEYFNLRKNNNCSFKMRLENSKEKYAHLQTKYPEFSTALNACDTHIPIFDDMIPQGITLMEEYTLITAYDNSEKQNSKCYVINAKGEIINIVTLETSSHVGGIAYDEENDLIWITGKRGTVVAYEAKDFLEKKDVLPKYTFDNLKEGLNYYKDSKRHHVAYLTIDDGYLYIGNFLISHNCTIKKYKIKNTVDGISTIYVGEFKVPPQIQGLTFYTQNDTKYMLLSSSFGRNNPSYLHIYEYSQEMKSYTDAQLQKKVYKFPPMLEQTAIKNGQLIPLFESNAKKYHQCEEKIEDICTLDINKLFIDIKKD